MMKLYSYKGPVYHFEHCINPKWEGFTMAPSKEKALSNLSFRAKRENNLISSTKLTLDVRCIKLEKENAQKK